MSFAIHYRTLCTVHFWHDFALARGAMEFAALPSSLQDQILADYSIHDWLRIEPATETRELLARHQLRFVMRPTGFILVGSVDAPGDDPAQVVLTSPLPADFVLRFTVKIVRSSFLQEANGTEPPTRPSIIHLTNRSGNAVNGELHLSTPLPAFDPAKVYRAGDLVVNSNAAPSALLESIEDQPSRAAPDPAKWVQLPAPLFDAAHAYQPGERAMHNGSVFEAKTAGPLAEPPDADGWRELYQPALRTGISPADSLPSLSRVTRFPLDLPLGLANLIVRDRTGAVVLSDAQFRRDGEPIQEITLSLEALPPGQYSLETTDHTGAAVPGLPTRFYLHPGTEPAAPYAVIEIANPPGPFELFDAAGIVRAPAYHVRFRHRHAFWLYTYRGDLSPFTPTHPGDVIQEDPADKSRYRTRTPLPLNLGAVSLKKFGASRLLPNPATPATRRENGKLYADTYLKT